MTTISSARGASGTLPARAKDGALTIGHWFAWQLSYRLTDQKDAKFSA
jgi:hypothetical protein